MHQRCSCLRVARLSIGSRPVCAACFAYERLVLQSRATDAERWRQVRLWELAWRAQQDTRRAVLGRRTAGL